MIPVIASVQERTLAILDVQRFTRRFPLLYHVADRSAWPSIVERGLLSTSALLDLYGIAGEDRRRIEEHPRRTAIVLERAGLPPAVIRDQKPLTSLADEHLDDGLTLRDWCRLLNRRVYLFTRRTDAVRFLAAYPGQHMYAIDTAELLARHADGVYLSSINAGNARRRPARRGLGTFVPIRDFDGRVAEFTVDWSIPDFFELTKDQGLLGR